MKTQFNTTRVKMACFALAIACISTPASLSAAEAKQPKQAKTNWAKRRPYPGFSVPKTDAGRATLGRPQSADRPIRFRPGPERPASWPIGPKHPSLGYPNLPSPFNDAFGAPGSKKRTDGNRIDRRHSRVQNRTVGRREPNPDAVGGGFMGEELTQKPFDENPRELYDIRRSVESFRNGLKQGKISPAENRPTIFTR